MLQGHMLANALTRPDLRTAQAHYRSVTFYFDTPLLVQLLGAEGTAKQEAASDLVRLLSRLRGRTAAFSHSLDELQIVLEGAADHLNSEDGRGGIVLGCGSSSSAAESVSAAARQEAIGSVTAW